MSSFSVPTAVSVLGLLAGIAHLLLPETLLATARAAYDLVLAVDFEPREDAPRRVRFLGVLFVVAALVAFALGRRG